MLKSSRVLAQEHMRDLFIFLTTQWAARMVLVLVMEQLVTDTNTPRSKLNKPSLHPLREASVGTPMGKPMDGARNREWDINIMVGLPVVKKRRARNCNMQGILVKARALATVKRKSPGLKN